MQKRRQDFRFVIAMITRKPFAVEIVDLIEDVSTNGVALRQALASPEVQGRFAPEHVGIVRSDKLNNTRKDIDKFCMKVGLTDEIEKIKFMLEFSKCILEALREIEEEENNSGTSIPIAESRWGRTNK